MDYRNLCQRLIAALRDKRELVGRLHDYHERREADRKQAICDLQDEYDDLLQRHKETLRRRSWDA